MPCPVKGAKKWYKIEKADKVESTISDRPRRWADSRSRTQIARLVKLEEVLGTQLGAWESLGTLPAIESTTRLGR